MNDDFGAGKGRPDEKSGRPESSPRAGEHSPWVLAGLGMQFFIALVLFAYAGAWLDKRFDSSPLMLLAGVFLGGGGTFYLTYRRLMGPGSGK